MELEKESQVQKQTELLWKNLKKEGLLGAFTTLLGAADYLASFLILSKRSSLTQLPTEVKYSLINIHAILCTVAKAINPETEENEIKIGGYLPVSPNDKIEFSTDMEKRFVLIVKLYYQDLKQKGLIT